MKNLAFIAIVLSFATPAFAAQKITSLSELQNSARLEQEAFAGNDCFLSVKNLGGGFSISAEHATDKAELLVGETDIVTLTTQEEEDGSFSRIYDVAGRGRFHVMHADDSFMAVEVSAGGRTVRCETDY